MDTRFHAVSIHYAEGACSAAKALSGQRYLADDAPQLPLAGCDASRCRCRFTHYKDRRSAGERRSPFGGPNYGDDSRSKLQERRSGDKRRRDADRGPE